MKSLIVEFDMDGDMVTAKLDTFFNLAESPCGFGRTKKGALINLMSLLNEDLHEN